MPFGKTNTSATFQALMNHIFQPYIRKFVLVFFYNILIYSPSWEQHLLHLDQIFQILLLQQLFVKLSKCALGREEVEYLGHIISEKGVAP